MQPAEMPVDVIHTLRMSASLSQSSADFQGSSIARPAFLPVTKVQYFVTGFSLLQ